jgi:hypothetical protein
MLATASLLILPSLSWARTRSNRLPARTLWHEGWITLRPMQPPRNSMTAVLHNRGNAVVPVPMSGPNVAMTLLMKTRDGWKDTGPGYCGNSAGVAPLAPMDSVEFEVTPTSLLSSLTLAVKQDYRVVLYLGRTHDGRDIRAVSARSFRFP